MNIIRKWKRFAAAGCRHGDLACAEATRIVTEHVLSTGAEYYDLGDAIDFASLRSKAVGTPDECVDLGADFQSAMDFMRAIRPKVWLQGNHDYRIYQQLKSHRGPVRELARYVVNEIQQVADECGTLIVPYHAKKGWHRIGDLWLCHGYKAAQMALRDHVLYRGGNVAMAHLHRAHWYRPDSANEHYGACVGTLAQPMKLTYAETKLAISSWGHGLISGEYCEDEAVWNLYPWKCAEGGPEECRFPV